MKIHLQLLSILLLHMKVTGSPCEDATIHCLLKFPPNWHRILRMENALNETSIQQICKHRFQLRICSNAIYSACRDLHSRNQMNNLYERLNYLCAEGRKAFRDATDCLNDRRYQLKCKSCYAVGRFYHGGLPEEDRCKIALRFVACFTTAAENFCHRKSRRFIERYNWITASFFVGCTKDWASFTSSNQASIRCDYFKTILTALLLRYFLGKSLFAFQI